MPILNVEGVTHWSIPVNDLEEAEECYGELLGLAPVGRLGNNIMSCCNVGDHNILLCERPNPVDGPLKEDAGVHHSFTVSPETFEIRCKVFLERNVAIDHLTYRARGCSPGGNCTSSIPAATGWSCEMPHGPRACPSRRLQNWPAHRPGQA